MGLIVAGDVAHDVGDGADPIEIVGTGILDILTALQQDADGPLLAQRLLGGGNRFGASDGDRGDHARKQHDVAHGNDD